jgi:hypothetical protein
MRFPPGMNREIFEKSGYMKSFPQLAGTVHSFCGNELDHMNLLQCMEVGEDWTEGQEADRNRADAGGLLSALSDGRPPRQPAEGRRAVRPAVLLLPP